MKKFTKVTTTTNPWAYTSNGVALWHAANDTQPAAWSVCYR